MYLGYLNKLVDESNNSYLHSIVKKSIDADYSTLTEKIESNPKAPKFKVVETFKVTLVISQEKYLSFCVES